MQKNIEVPVAAFSLDAPWTPPAGVPTVDLVDVTSGAEPRLRTSLSVWRDDRRLYALFLAEDDELHATLLDHDSDIWTEDVCEVFLAPRTLEDYFEIEVNPLGTTFDARVTSPDRARRTMRVDRSWTCDGLWPAVRIQREDGRVRDIATLIAIPFASLPFPTPQAGESWRGNFYRIDRGARDEYSAWSPTMAEPADFHLPERFGTITFV